MSSFHLES